MHVLFKNKNKMRSYINEFLYHPITDGDWQDWLDYLTQYGNWMLDDIDDFEEEIQCANLTLISSDKDYYVCVMFDFSERDAIQVDLDYKKCIESE